MENNKDEKEKRNMETKGFLLVRGIGTTTTLS